MNRWILAAGLGALVVLTACGGDDEEPKAPAGLESMVEAVMPRLQVLAGLKKKGELTMEMQSRDSLRRYIESRMTEEMPVAELEGIRVTYVTLGLLPDTLNLRQMLLDLYTEQVVGYYDPDTKKLYVVEGVPDEALEPVLVHELVHALQDQYTNLDSLIAPERGNDRQSAAQAAIEGHATMVMFAYLLEKQTKSPVDPRTMRNVADEIRPALEGQNSVLPVFQNAPRILRETLLFPYAGGAGFVQKLWIRPLESGFGDPYPAPLGDKMPSSTEQILHPDSRFMVQRDEPTELRIGPTTQKTIRDNSVGELEISVLLEEHLGPEARRQSHGWDGDRYRLLDVGGTNTLLWYSVWDDAGAADGFAVAYRRIAEKRGRTVTVDRIDIQGRPGIRIIDPATPSLNTATVVIQDK